MPPLPAPRRPATARAAAGLLAALLLLGPSLAGAHFTPLEVKSTFAYAGDAIRGMGASLFERQPDTFWPMASTTKFWALHLAVDAVQKGLVDPHAFVRITHRAAHETDCCSTLTDVNGVPIEAGERIPFKHLLRGMMYPSGGDATLAVAEAVARAKIPGCHVAGGQDLCVETFVLMMNDHAKALGLKNARYRNPDGRDMPGHETSARDMAAGWLHAMEDPLFREIVGFHGFCSMGTGYAFAGFLDNGTAKNYCLSFNGAWTPGLQGWKGGNHFRCNNPVPLPYAAGCMIGSAQRAGRVVVAANLQGWVFEDPKRMYDLAFDAIFHPRWRAGHVTGIEASGGDVACVSRNHAVSAVVSPAGQTKLVLWDHDHGQQVLEAAHDTNHGPLPGKLHGNAADALLPAPAKPLAAQLAPHVAPLAGWANDRGYASLAALGNAALAPPWDLADDAVARVPDVPLPGLPPGGLPPLLPGGPGPVPGVPGAATLQGLAEGPVLAVDVAHLGESVMALAQRTATLIRLDLWGITPDDTFVHLAGPVVAGTGKRVAVEALPGTGSPGVFVTAITSEQDEVEVSAWRASRDPWAIEHASDAPQRIGGATEAALAASSSAGLGPQVMLATVAGGDLRVDSWRVVPDGSKFVHGGELFRGRASRIALASTPLVPDPQAIDPTGEFTVAFRDGDGLLRLYVFDAGFSGLAFVGGSDGIVPLVPDETPVMATLGTGGVFLAFRDAAAPLVTLRTFDAQWLRGTVLVRNLTEDRTSADKPILGLCRVPYAQATAPSDGDYLLTYAAPALAAQALRSGERPVPPAPAPSHPPGHFP